MSKDYFYFAASLPMIVNIDSECPCSTEDYLGRCEQLLTGEDFADLHQVLLEDGSLVVSADPMVQKIADANRDFRNALVWFRAARAGHDPLDYLRGDRFNDPFWADIVNRALKFSNLMEGKRLIDQTRWQALDDLIMGHHFDLSFLIVYGLKLRLLERYQEIHTDKGAKLFDELRAKDVLASASQKG